jgi:hypothetical protein
MVLEYFDNSGLVSLKGTCVKALVPNLFVSWHIAAYSISLFFSVSGFSPLDSKLV